MTTLPWSRPIVDEGGRFDIRNRYFALCGTPPCLFAGLGLLVVPFMGAGETLDSSDAPYLLAVLASWISVIGPLAWRLWTVRLTDVCDAVVVRNVFTTRRLPWPEVRAIDVARGVSSRPGNSYAYVRFVTSGRPVKAAATLTYSRGRASEIGAAIARRAADLGLPCDIDADDLVGNDLRYRSTTNRGDDRPS